MTALRFVALPTETTGELRAGKHDANGQPPERHVSDGSGTPCRHCMTEVEAGETFLILAYRPFPEPQPYAEVGPIFLHADACERYDHGSGLPPVLRDRERYLIRGYSDANRIVYGTGQSAAAADLENAAARMFERPEVAYIHVRSASNNCYQCRIERA